MDTTEANREGTGLRVSTPALKDSMVNEQQSTVCIVDSDTALLQKLRTLMGSARIPVETYCEPGEFL